MAKPTLEETMELADKFWGLGVRKDGSNTLGFPSKESYLVYVKDLYINVIAKMSDAEYEHWDSVSKKTIVDKLRDSESQTELVVRTQEKEKQDG